MTRFRAVPGTGRAGKQPSTIRDDNGHGTGGVPLCQPFRTGHPEDRDRVVAAISAALEAGGTYEAEYRIRRPDGALRWVGARGRVVLRDGLPTGMSGVCSDITDRRREAQGLELLAEASRVLFASLKPEVALDQVVRLLVPRLADWAGVYMVDEAGDLHKWAVVHHDEARQLLGKTLSERLVTAESERRYDHQDVALAQEFAYRAALAVDTARRYQHRSEVIAAQLAPDRFCTLACGSLQPDGQGFHLRVASAGHPLPLLLRRDGTTESVGVPGTLLAALPTEDFHDVECRLGPGDVIVLFSDGVLSERLAGIAAGESRLREALAGCAAGLPAQGIADHLERHVRSSYTTGLDDDVALLVLKVSPGPVGRPA